MTKIYEVTVGRVDCEGRFLGYERVAFASTKEIANSIVEKFQIEHKVNQYWCYYKTDSGLLIKDGDDILMKINEFELVTE